MSDTARALEAWWPYRERLEAWGQTAGSRVPDPEAAASLIDRTGIATVFATSPEIANLFHAHMGNPEARTDSKHDSPSGRVYSWRWALGRERAAFYAIIVRKRPTFVRWALVPAILRLVGDLRTPDELYDFGVISANAYRITRVLEDADEPVGTGDLRAAAGFPKGRENSSAYHKALEELDGGLLITNEFVPGDDEGLKHHGLMFKRRRDDAEAAANMGYEEAIDEFLRAYLPAARYAVPTVLSKHMRLQPAQLIAGLEKLRNEGLLDKSQVPGSTSQCWVWKESA